MTKAEMIKRYGIEWYNDFKERCKENNKKRYKNDPEYRDYQISYQNEYHKVRCKNDPEYRDYYVKYSKEYQKERYKNDPEYRDYFKEYRRTELNSKGKTKMSIRAKSNYILFDQRHHTKIKDYEIHHCFGYEDPSKFIYIPKSLHNKIHQYLRDNNITADSNHYDYIKYMLNDCEEYTYISV